MNRKKRRGQGMVELAFLFPFFLLVIVGGIIDFGFAFYNLVTLQEIANDAAQFAAESNGHSGVSDVTAIQAHVNASVPQWWGTVTASSTDIVIPGSNPATTCKRVLLSYPSRTYTPFYQTMLHAVAGSTAINLQAVAVYQVPTSL
ncbi:MAG: pilus assembly protein [Candidatus Riflebacteria bacterium]|nr:pilus assembly protein [Candidatus Riflebacteria bacterium]